jgi:hypothetical protein
MRLIASPRFGPLDKLDFVTFGCVNESDPAAVLVQMRAVGIFQASRGQVFGELFEAIDFKRQVRQVRLDLHGAAGGEGAQFDEFLAFRRLHKDQFRTARRFVPVHFRQAEHLLVESDGALKIIHPVTGMQQFPRDAHALRILTF